MEPKVSYLLVGLFVLVLGVVFLGVVVWLGKADLTKSYDRYYALMHESVSGMSVDSPVKYRGVDVGRVTDIRLNPENPEQVRLTLDIVSGTPIKEDTVAIIHTQGLTGFANVDLTGGTRDSPPLMVKPGQRYPEIKTGPSLWARLDGAVSRLLDDRLLSGALQNLGSLSQEARGMVDQENRAALKQILTDLAAVSKTLASRGDAMDRGMVSTARTAENLAKLSKTMNDHVPALLTRINKIAAALQTVTDEMARTSHAVASVVTESGPNVERFSRETLGETQLLVSELRELTATLNRVAQELEREPNALVLGRSARPKGPGE